MTLHRPKVAGNQLSNHRLQGKISDDNSSCFFLLKRRFFSPLSPSTCSWGGLSDCLTVGVFLCIIVWSLLYNIQRL